MASIFRPRASVGPLVAFVNPYARGPKAVIGRDCWRELDWAVSEFQPPYFSGFTEKAGILFRRQYAPLWKYADDRPLMPLQ